MNPVPATALARWIPALQWLHHYEKSWLRGDLIAGITLAAYLLPAALGDASLANLPPQAGLYACLFGGLVFWLFCSSRHTAITVTSAISLLVGASLAGISGGDPMRFGALAAGNIAQRRADKQGNGGGDGDGRVARAAEQPEDQPAKQARVESRLGIQPGK